MRGIYTAALLALLSIGAKAQTFTWTGFKPIFDFQTDTVIIPVNGLPNVIDSSFGIAHVCFDITHTYIGDLSIRIVSPAGTSVDLVQTKGGSGQNYTGTCVGMDGTSFSNSTAPFTGIFVPIGNLAGINNGQNPNGNWLFIFNDNANQDTGSVHSASLAFANVPPQQTIGTAVVPTGTYVWPGVVCPGGANSCDLLPDMTASAKEIQLNHNEVPGALYISNATPNIGYGPMEIYGVDSCYCGTTLVPCGTVCPNGEELQHLIRQRIYQKQPGTDTLTYYDRNAGRMTYHPNHGHLHVDDWSHYTLRSATSNPDARTWPIIGTGTKQSFCLINLGTCSGNVGECKDSLGNNVTTVPNQNIGFHTGCGLTQGIYSGNYDVYNISLNEPIPLENVCNGTYYVVSITDPEDNFIESNENNNWVAVPVTLTQQNQVPTISTAASSNVICPGDSIMITASTASNYAWSTGETTQSIYVKNAGSYTVSTNCGTSVSTSSPYTLTVNQVNVNANSTPTLICEGETIQLTSNASSNTVVNTQNAFTSNQQVFIPDNFSTGVYSPISVSGISPVTLSANSIISVSMNITHTYDGDLLISLIAPSGNSIMLSNRRGGSGNNFTNTVFSMSAATLISAGSAPFAGTYKPDGNFSSLSGNANGTWQLRVQDLAGQDTGRIWSWNISMSNTGQETFNYEWTSLPQGFISTVQNPIDNPVASILYQVQATSNITGCRMTATIPVTVITISSFAPMVAQQGTSILVNGVGLSNVISVTIGGTVCPFTIMDDTQISVIAPDISGPVCVSTSNCTHCTLNSFTSINGTNVNVNLKVFIEGFYLGNGTLEASVDPLNHPTLCDTILLELRNSNNYAIEFSDKSIINTNGNGEFEFPVSASGESYYLAVHHRNAIETWSANVVVISNNMTYDFTNLSSKAYGSNQYSFGDGKFGLYSGDISDATTTLIGIQDGVVESQDYLEMENAVAAILTGYIVQDITGDGVSEATDYLIMENNVAALVFSMRP